MRNTAFALVLATAALLPSPAPTTAAPPAPNFEVIATYTVPAGGAEIGAATQDGRYLAVTAAETKKVALLDISTPSAPSQVCAFDTTAFGEPTSVDIPKHGRYALVAIKSDPNPGRVAAFAIPTCQTLWDVTVGIGPDSIVIAPNDDLAVVAIEDEEEVSVGDPAACPTANVRPGSVDVIDLKGQGAPSRKRVAIDLIGTSGVNCPNDPQPEGIAISRDSRLAYVTLQENNALATIDLHAGSVANVISMGTTTHAADVKDDGVISITDPYTGRREPDGIAVSRDGRWLFTADEGDSSNTASAFSGGRTMTVLRAARLRGSHDREWDDEDDDRIGARGGPGHGGPGRGQVHPPRIVTDTGDLIERTAAARGVLNDGRSDNRGPEPEGITTFRVGPRELAAVTLERSDAVIVFDVTNPRRPTVLDVIPTGDAPEGILYVQSRKLLIATNEADGSITIVCARMGGGGCN